MWYVIYVTSVLASLQVWIYTEKKKGGIGGRAQPLPKQNDHTDTFLKRNAVVWYGTQCEYNEPALCERVECRLRHHGVGCKYAHWMLSKCSQKFNYLIDLIVSLSKTWMIVVLLFLNWCAALSLQNSFSMKINPKFVIIGHKLTNAQVGPGGPRSFGTPRSRHESRHRKPNQAKNTPPLKDSLLSFVEAFLPFFLSFFLLCSFFFLYQYFFPFFSFSFFILLFFFSVLSFFFLSFLVFPFLFVSLPFLFFSQHHFLFPIVFFDLDACVSRVSSFKGCLAYWLDLVGFAWSVFLSRAWVSGMPDLPTFD